MSTETLQYPIGTRVRVTKTISLLAKEGQTGTLVQSRSTPISKAIEGSAYDSDGDAYVVLDDGNPISRLMGDESKTHNPPVVLSPGTTELLDINLTDAQ